MKALKKEADERLFIEAAQPDFAYFAELWVSRSPNTGEFEEVIMIAVAIEEMVGSDRVLTPTIRSEPRLESANHDFAY